MALIVGFVRTVILIGLDSLAIAKGALFRSQADYDCIAVVKVDAIGDFIVWMKAAENLRRAYGSEKVVLVANVTWAELALDTGVWDTVIPVDVPRFRKNMGYRFSMVSRLGDIGCAIAISPTHSRSFHVDDALIRATRARVRIGSSGDLANMKPWHKKLSDRFYTRVIPVPGSDESELVRHFHFLRGLGIESPQIEVANLRSYAEDVKNPYASLAQYYVLVPGAGWSGRQWPAERYGTIAGHLYGVHHLAGVVAGSASEADLARRIVNSATADLQSAVGLTDLRKLVALVRDARLVVCNETSVVHIAAAVGVPCVCLLGGGHFGRFAPYRPDWKSVGALPVSLHRKMSCFGCNWRCIYRVPRKSAVPCIDGISVEEVVAVIDDVLRGELRPLNYALPLAHGWLNCSGRTAAGQ